jgi:hypothetical protein
MSLEGIVYVSELETAILLDVKKHANFAMSSLALANEPILPIYTTYLNLPVSPNIRYNSLNRRVEYVIRHTVIDRPSTVATTTVTDTSGIVNNITGFEAKQVLHAAAGLPSNAVNGMSYPNGYFQQNGDPVYTLLGNDGDGHGAASYTIGDVSIVTRPFRYELWVLYVQGVFDVSQVETFRNSSIVPDKPNYMDLLKGYSLDARTIPDNPSIVPTESKIIQIGYYRENILEPIPSLRSIDWMTYDVTLITGQTIVLPIADCVLGTLHCSDVATLTQITGLPTQAGRYNWSDLLPTALPQLFAGWQALRTASIFYPSIPGTLLGTITTTESGRTLRTIGANNNVWGNKPVGTSDLNTVIFHPMFAIDDSRSYNWHIEPQANNKGTGTLIMDSPRTIEIHQALEAQNYLQEYAANIGNGTIANPQYPARHTLGYWITHPPAVDNTKVNQIHTALNAIAYQIESGGDDPATPHKLDWYIKNSGGKLIKDIWNAVGGLAYAYKADGTTQRVTNLGFLIENMAKILGLRLTEEGKVDREKEKSYVRKILSNPKYEEDAYAINCFGIHGRLTPHLTNSNGNKAYDVVYDIPQMLEAQMEHVNRSLGVQAGTEIKIVNPVTGKTDYYPNQLALLLDIHSKMTATAQDSKETYNLSFSIAQMVRELFSGIGVPTVFKNLWTRYGRIPYLGHQVDKGSINTSLTTLKVNLGMVLGNMLQSKPNPKLALSRFFKK